MLLFFSSSFNCGNNSKMFTNDQNHIWNNMFWLPTSWIGDEVSLIHGYMLACGIRFCSSLLKSIDRARTVKIYVTWPVPTSILSAYSVRVLSKFHRSQVAWNKNGSHVQSGLVLALVVFLLRSKKKCSKIISRPNQGSVKRFGSHFWQYQKRFQMHQNQCFCTKCFTESVLNLI